MVEFAIVVPVFLMLLLALIDFSRLIFTSISLTNGARELARSLTITSTSASTGTAAFNNLTVIAGSTQGATSVTVQPSVGGVSGSPLTCSLSSSSPCGVSIVTTDPTPPATSPGTVKVTNLNTGTLTSFTAPSSSLSFGPTGNGDFVSEMWVSSDPDGWPQAYIQICQLPLTSACTLPSFSGTTGRGSFTNGYVQVDLAYTFTWVPLFQNRLGGVIDAGFQRMTTLVTTSTRTYAE